MSLFKEFGRIFLEGALGIDSPTVHLGNGVIGGWGICLGEGGDEAEREHDGISFSVQAFRFKIGVLIV